MKSKKRVYINGDQRLFICNLVAQYKKPREIVSLMEEEHDIIIKGALVSRYKNSNKDLIDKLRSQYLANINDIPIAQKRIRLERADELYDASQEIHTVKDRVDSGLKCLKEAREETEGKGQSVTFQQFNQYNQLTDEELEDKLKEIEFKVAKTKAVEV